MAPAASANCRIGTPAVVRHGPGVTTGGRRSRSFQKSASPTVCQGSTTTLTGRAILAGRCTVRMHGSRISIRSNNSRSAHLTLEPRIYRPN